VLRPEVTAPHRRTTVGRHAQAAKAWFIVAGVAVFISVLQVLGRPDDGEGIV
jgi:hypothetical protein